MSEAYEEPAFPSVAEGGTDSGLHPELNRGMSMRDWFAGQSLVGLTTVFYSGNDADEAARRAYKFADAMLAERGKATGAA